MTAARGAKLRLVAQISRFTAAESPGTLLRDLRRMLGRAYGDDFTHEDWNHSLGGFHVVAGLGGRPVAHAAIVPRTIEVDGEPFHTGYVEAVATDPDHQGQGLATAVMGEAADIIRQRFDLGALSTGAHWFFERLGWERWQGPTHVRDESGLRRTPDEDGGVMVLRFDASEQIDLGAPIACEARPGDDW